MKVENSYEVKAERRVGMSEADLNFYWQLTDVLNYDEKCECQASSFSGRIAELKSMADATDVWKCEEASELNFVFKRNTDAVMEVDVEYCEFSKGIVGVFVEVRRGDKKEKFDRLFVDEAANDDYAYYWASTLWGDDNYDEFVDYMRSRKEVRKDENIDKVKYFGIIDLEYAPFVTGINVMASSDDAAKRVYEGYANSIGGYIHNLWKLDEENERRYGDQSRQYPIIF